MDIERQLQELKQVADRTVLSGLEVDVAFRSRVKQKLATTSRQNKRWNLVVLGLIAAFIFLFAFTNLISPSSLSLISKPFPDRSNASGRWELSKEQSGTSDGKAFNYLGEKPVRIMTTDLYEDQGQKTIWLLDGPIKSGERVQIIGTKDSGEQANLGSWTVGEALFDATGHFPSSIALPSPGVWKLDVMTSNGSLGSVTVQVNAGVAPYSEWLEDLIVSYIQSDQEFGWIGQPRFASIDMFGVYGPSADQKYVYAWVLVESYKQENGNLVQEAGWSFPAKFVVDYVNGDYRVTKMEAPSDGSEYWPSIEQIFPTKYHKTIKEKTGNVAELQKQIVKKAQDFFSQKK
ncbi:hypothetical protein [Brevibacillus sp. SYSU BS000544]|uniref:hypothetical protein n=1 Tax=Brevibacillus sp. SYSU BS000544 TaxID=3416443 RepID=UPI003CE5B209